MISPQFRYAPCRWALVAQAALRALATAVLWLFAPVLFHKAASGWPASDIRLCLYVFLGVAVAAASAGPRPAVAWGAAAAATVLGIVDGLVWCGLDGRAILVDGASPVGAAFAGLDVACTLVLVVGFVASGRLGARGAMPRPDR